MDEKIEKLKQNCEKLLQIIEEKNAVIATLQQNSAVPFTHFLGVFRQMLLKIEADKLLIERKYNTKRSNEWLEISIEKFEELYLHFSKEDTKYSEFLMLLTELGFLDTGKKLAGINIIVSQN